MRNCPRSFWSPWSVLFLVIVFPTLDMYDTFSAAATRRRTFDVVRRPISPMWVHAHAGAFYGITRYSAVTCRICLRRRKNGLYCALDVFTLPAPSAPASSSFGRVWSLPVCVYVPLRPVKVVLTRRACRAHRVIKTFTRTMFSYLARRSPAWFAEQGRKRIS